MQRDLEFSSPHLEHQRNAANEVKKNVFRRRNLFKSEIEQLQNEDVEDVEELGDLVQSDLDQAFGNSVRLTDAEAGDNEGAQMTAATIAHNDLIQGGNYRLDHRESLMESFQERLARLERKWFAERMGNLEVGIENMSTEEIQNRNQELIDKIRRIKLKVDQEAIKHGEELMFEEHSNLTEEQILAESVPLERLINYYRLPKEQRQSNPADDYQFRSSMGFMNRKEVIEDLYDPTQVNQDAHLSLQDTTYKPPASKRDENLAQRQIDAEEFEQFKLEQQKEEMNIRGNVSTKKKSQKQQAKAAKIQVNTHEKKAMNDDTLMLIKFLQKEKNA